MKAVILAAGEGIRMRPLTLETPKTLLEINGKAIIDYIFESFPNEITEFIVVINYLGKKIEKHLSTINNGKRVNFIKGSNKGSAYSFLATKNNLKKERFLLVQGDELISGVDVRSCLKNELSILTFETKNPSVCGIAYLKKDGSIKKIIEKPKSSKSKIAVNGLMVLNTDIFNYTPKSQKGEYFFSSMVAQFIKDHKVYPVKSRGSIFDITSPSDIDRASKILKRRENKKI